MGVLDSFSGLLKSVPVIGGVASGLLGATQETPELKQAYLDPATQKLFEKRGNEAMQDSPTAEKAIVDQQNANVDDGKFFLKGGNVDSPMREALQRREQRDFGSLTNKMRRSDAADAPKTQAARVAGTISAVRNDAAHALDFAEKAKLASQNKRFARNNAINGILRGSGAGLGAVIGGKQGAIIGQTAGAMAGNAATPGGDLNYI